MVVGLFLLSACAQKEISSGPVPQAPVSPPEEAVSPPPSPPVAGERPSGVKGPPAFSEESLEAAARKARELPPEERLRLYGRSTPPLKAIFFDFDDYRIRPDMIPRLEEDARFLLQHPEYRVELQGNCDERGDRDYNLALGEKRALEVKKYLENLGVSPERLSTVSFGEERPLAPGHNEAAWALNRRVDLVILKNP
ncbi:peptidoglycan-associated lipoprotein Pal [Thermosulfurimonas marina]|uniref:Peptidoglycan-associated protein n=2 Tax=Thermosulfurimonas marina TaxID=2047767 RepID=A0A6H1WV09_9BACT|nr:peptidoglycan-associated lipoprotein Pal [Thermosulfurimonas marina]